MKMLAKGTGKPDEAAAIAWLLETGLWDAVAITDREAWCNRTEVYDTPGGRMIADALEQWGILPLREPANLT